MPVCKRCGTPLPEIARYCYICGAPVNDGSGNENDAEMRLQDIVANRSTITQTTVGTINITNHDPLCPNCGNLITDKNHLLRCSECGRSFCETCESWFKKAPRQKGEPVLCEDCYREKEAKTKKDINKKLDGVLGGTVATISYTSLIGIEFVKLPIGKFVMGSAEVDDAPPHLVKISRPFYISRYPVTQSQWAFVMGNNPSRFRGNNNPVERITYKDVWRFLERLNRMDKDRNYRLPTEAEWEYACRAGTRTRYYFGDTQYVLEDYAWYRKNSGRRTHPVGMKKPNNRGLYDMHGNIWEWCYDRYGKYPRETLKDPTGPTNGRERVIRGGSWYSKESYLLSAFRHSYDPSHKDDNLGFRLVIIQ